MQQNMCTLFSITGFYKKMLVNLPNLELLDLSDCEQLTDAAIKAIVFHCRLLRSLNVSGCSKVHHQ